MPRPPTSLAPVPAVHPERDALLAAIAADPEPDLPRLVYADWQDDHGQPEHAALIRVQCELKRATGRALTPRRRELRARVKELLATPALRPMRRTWWGCPSDLDRGFNRHDTVMYDPDDPRAYAPDRPVADGELPLDKILALHLNVWNGCPPQLAATLAAAPWLPRVTALEFSDCRLGPGSLRAFARSPLLTTLTELGFWQGSVDAGEFARLALAPGVRLVELALTCDCGVTTGRDPTPDAGALAVALARIGRSRRAAGLRVLYLDSPQAGEAVGRVLAAAPRLGGLASLVLARSRVGRRVRAELAARFKDRVHFQPW